MYYISSTMINDCVFTVLHFKMDRCVAKFVKGYASFLKYEDSLQTITLTKTVHVIFSI